MSQFPPAPGAAKHFKAPNVTQALNYLGLRLAKQVDTHSASASPFSGDSFQGTGTTEAEIGELAWLTERDAQYTYSGLTDRIGRPALRRAWKTDQPCGVAALRAAFARAIRSCRRFMTVRIEDLPPEESDALLNAVVDHCEKPQFGYRPVRRVRDPSRVGQLPFDARARRFSLRPAPFDVAHHREGDEEAVLRAVRSSAAQQIDALRECSPRLRRLRWSPDVSGTPRPPIIRHGRGLKPHSVRGTFDSCRDDAIEGSRR